MHFNKSRAVEWYVQTLWRGWERNHEKTFWNTYFPPEPKTFSSFQNSLHTLPVSLQVLDVIKTESMLGSLICQEPSRILTFDISRGYPVCATIHCIPTVYHVNHVLDTGIYLFSVVRSCYAFTSLWLLDLPTHLSKIKYPKLDNFNEVSVKTRSSSRRLRNI